ncbi:SDR family oxidoreductase [Paenibacillus radicis (ex Gao et al. 2016)]|uniref:Oxidoreductase n=1 Tax=Paenibacillus radicis (ex Gao et al. 2016) TaxID=1737354 RepID=A0A917GQZ4_9BACL|nr:SDR family oxidoreductase [Paenibacillus radicis (ex Gao et al. 2016)]GGG54355.1 oxidoreductase [Paenibacillus radicis (ex Gao et al. 2016)]
MLKGKTAVITGASSGIGRSVALRLAREGIHVFITGRSEEPLEHLKHQIEAEGGRASAKVFDIRDTAALQHFIQDAHTQTGRLDMLVNNAGLHLHGSIVDTGPESWREMIDVNIIALLAGTQAAVQAMRLNNEGGHIVNISSGNAKEPGSDFYSATKHMVNALGQALTKELAREPIRITTIMPGAVATNFGRTLEPARVEQLAQALGMELKFNPGDHLPEALLKRLHEAMGQTFLSSEDIAEAVLYALNQPLNIVVRELYVTAPNVYLGNDVAF